MKLIFIEGKVASLIPCRLKNLSILDNPQTGTRVGSAISDDEVTKIYCRNQLKKRLKNDTVGESQILIPYRGMALIYGIIQLKWIIVAWLIWSMLLVEFWLWSWRIITVTISNYCVS